ncbi:35837_t:CDS:2, partial [Racocetra persica]
CYIFNGTNPDGFNGLASIGLSDPFKDRDGSLMDPGLCIYHCANYGFVYSGLTKGDECRCGGSTALVTYTKLNDTLSKIVCNASCVGNSSYPCGGDIGYTIYQEPIPMPPKISALQKVSIIQDLKNNKKYIGCFKESPNCNQRILKGSNEEVISLSVEDCVNFCKSNHYNYAGLEIGTQCFCDNDFKHINMLRPEECSSSCTGNDSEICGGPLAVSIYSVPSDTDNTIPIVLGVVIPLFIIITAAICGCYIYKRRSKNQTQDETIQPNTEEKEEI